MPMYLASPPTTGSQLSGRTKIFRTPAGPVHAVRGVDVAIAPGETAALLGPNGAGKTTTIDMLLGLLPPDAGTVPVFGMTPADAIAAGVARQDGGVRHPLPRRGRRLRRPDHPDGERESRRRRTRHRDQGDG